MLRFSCATRSEVAVVGIFSFTIVATDGSVAISAATSVKFSVLAVAIEIFAAIRAVPAKSSDPAAGAGGFLPPGFFFGARLVGVSFMAAETAAIEGALIPCTALRNASAAA